MAYRAIRGTRFKSTEEVKPDTALCKRCGLRRSTHKGDKTRTGLCKSCVSVLTPEELELWKEQAA